ncbi:alpha-l-rhamnosidase [Colletotrichum musicola]|uniref:alpha-L-rhamnosidase n=1 Tax=Colletotrichum musicola TaxID=2175873 RepID=A0A8H6JA70_9PEZI|nr:alpha-l-rhamnosidase [Colletotrichum musicola]
MGGGYRNDPNWGSAVVLVPLKAYKQYGDVSILSKKRTEMVEYLDYLIRRAGEKPYLNDGGLGDWLALDTSTPKGAASTFGFHSAARGMAEVEAFLGDEDSSRRYAELAQSLREGFHQMWFNTSASRPQYCTGSQGCNAFALGMGAAPSQEISDAVLEGILDSLEARGWALTAGEISLPSLFEALRDAGHDDALFKLMTNDRDWGYGRMIREGATSLWEHWDLPVTGGSRNHFMFGYGDAWIIGLAGLRQKAGSVGWREVEYKPVIVGDLQFAETRYRAPAGEVAAKWKLEGEVLEYEIVVPVGSTGWVEIPVVEVQEGGGRVVAGENGVLAVEESEGGVKIVVGSGSYSFTGTVVKS